MTTLESSETVKVVGALSYQTKEGKMTKPKTIISAVASYYRKGDNIYVIEMDVRLPDGAKITFQSTTTFSTEALAKELALLIRESL